MIKHGKNYIKNRMKNIDDQTKPIDVEKRILVIESEINILRKKLEKKMNDYDYFNAKSFQEFDDYLNPENTELSILDREKRMIMTPEFSMLSNVGDVMTLKDFIENVNYRGFIDYDGSGNYVRGDEESNITIYPSDIEHNSIRKDFDMIVWYNK